MRAAILYRAGDVRVENVPDAAIKQPTDALLRIIEQPAVFPDALRPKFRKEGTGADGGRNRVLRRGR